MEDHQHFAVGRLFPDRVGARDVALQYAERSGFGIEVQGQVIRFEPARALCNQSGEGVLAHQRMQHLDAVFLEVGG